MWKSQGSCKLTSSWSVQEIATILQIGVTALFGKGFDAIDSADWGLDLAEGLR
jgi:hypothetical protein